ncbi:putative nudix hydrolase [Candidatus Protochlamydia naegleriophila]|uniref:Putative nudix hydrolase n=1 Tax=Candidatus Protochlamydia naegleriophila TaxID=389348 RepID=A0A0U5ESP6_9BACT|nr:NUDIX domain-containing protein [Candidatus Protochlamydia naegleriophila]CUI17169.1 putative nudix hydrolase [Candidatus Protochlamydia naegleriophila]
MNSLTTTLPVSYEVGEKYFNYRTCGIALNDGRVLAVKISPYDFWLFPGGRVEFMESSQVALEREIKEELKIPCRVERPLWIVEDFYSFENQKVHELGYYYLIDFPSNKEIYEKKEEWSVYEEEKINERAKTLTFRWLPLNHLESVDLRPGYIKTRLSALPDNTEHLIIDSK